MTTETQGTRPEHIELISDLVAAYVSNNHVAPADLPALIASIHASISGLGTGTAVTPVEEPAEKITPAQIRKSVQPEGLISFLDGKSYKTLNRHLTKHGLDPKSYRERFGLPSDYPMVSAAYSEKRSSLAKALGLGISGSHTARVEDVTAAPKGRKKAA
ncbi:MucR family transcriptional regulator [Methylobacterium sp. J-076]|uniref:MucR family transcriptional regulator n=1 Tax=Methylobacterium sp. J-076 TaxID=2836655 RepID=UPI001FBB7A8F|nr:MucR family transcriptional regulator [Methylobacterium sp. J-076]MCJ2011503.1 MucR family transcriptional regulator [Methylobacterium sp. J-076]